MKKVLLFDLNEVIICPSRELFSVQFSRKYNIPLDSIVGFIKGEEFQKALIGKADLKEIIEPYLKEWGWFGTVEDVLEFWFKSESEMDTRFLEIIEAIREKGYKVYAGTNQERYRTEHIRFDMGLDKCFDKFFSSCYIGAKKPDYKFYNHFLNEIEAEPEEVIFWDDSEKNINAAKNLGIDAHQYKNYEEFLKIMKNYFSFI